MIPGDNPYVAQFTISAILIDTKIMFDCRKYRDVDDDVPRTHTHHTIVFEGYHTHNSAICTGRFKSDVVFATKEELLQSL